MREVFFVCIFASLSFFVKAQSIYMVSTGDITFTSDAPLELIEAENSTMQGALKIADRSFVFRVPMKNFDGFNSSLQKTHFNTNYLETSKFPHTQFEGKIIEDIDFSVPGNYTVRGKGKFNCHGVEQERIIKCKVNVKSGVIKINSEFSVLLDDHNIKIPSVMNQKIAEEIVVVLEMELKEKK